MKLTSTKKIIVEDYSSDDRELVQRLAQTLNPLIEQATAAINGNLTSKDNLKSKTYNLDLAAGVSTYTVAFDLNEKPTAVLLAQLTKTDYSAPAAAFSLSWKYENQKIMLTLIGLNGSTAHKATILALV